MNYQKISILSLIESNETGGAETVFLNIVKYLDPNKFTHFIGLGGYGWLYGKIRELGYAPIVFDSKGSFNIKYLFSLIYFIKKNNIKIIHAHLLGANVYASIASLFSGIKVISTFHGESDVNINKFSSRIKLAIINLLSKRIVFVSNFLKNYFIERYCLNFKKIDVVYNGVNFIEWSSHARSYKLRKLLGVQGGSVLIGAVGDVRHPKGYDVLLKTAHLLKECMQDFYFVILGDNQGEVYEELLQLRARLSLENKFHFLGHREDVNVLIHDFDIFVLPSISEGFSICTIEAMAAGVPVIVAKCGGPEEIVKHRKNGLLVGVNDANAFKEAILEVVSRETLRNELLKQAQIDVVEKFSTQQMIMNYENIYTKTLQSHKIVKKFE